MPDITNNEKTAIRSRAKRLVQKIWASSFSDGVWIYSELAETLYMKSARWRICLRCGEIKLKETMVDGKHKCDFNTTNFPVLVATSWYKLKEFFLDGGIEKISETYDLDIKLPKIITKEMPSQVEEEVLTEEQVEIENTS